MEKLRGKPISEKVEENLTRVGLSLLLLLIAFVFYNDIVRFGPKIWNKKKGVQIEESSTIDQDGKLLKE